MNIFNELSKPELDLLLKSMSDTLDILGFKAMSKDILTETDLQRVSRYARVILHNMKSSPYKKQVFYRYKLLGLI